MLDANTEIHRLRQNLRFKNLPDVIIDSICEDVASEISDITSDILADAMSQAVEAGADAGSVDFIDEIRATRNGPSFQITTDSGRVDFSEAPFPMLPKLLKNAKVSKDGSLYKVVPLKQGTSRVPATTEAAMNNINQARAAAKEQRDSVNSTVSTMDTMKGMDTIAAMQSINKRKTPSRESFNTTNTISGFRTASSKQDASTQWINPGRKADMSEALQRINANLQDSIDRAIEDVIRRYNGMY